MNIDVLTKSITHQENVRNIFQIIDHKIHIFILQDHLSQNEKFKIDKNWKNMTLAQLYERVILDKTEVYWKIVTNIVSNITIGDISVILNKDKYDKNNKEILENMMFDFIDIYFNTIKFYITFDNMNIKFKDQLQKYCNQNFEKLHKDLYSFCILSSVVNLSKFGEGIWETYEKTIFKKYFTDKNFSNEYVKFWSNILKFQQIPNILMKRFIPNFVKFNEIKYAISHSKYIAHYLNLFEGTKYEKIIKDLEINHQASNQYAIDFLYL